MQSFRTSVLQGREHVRPPAPLDILTRGQPGRVLRVGDPEPTNRYTVEALRKMGVVGIYEVLT